jgi:hypothetical protein
MRSTQVDGLASPKFPADISVFQVCRCSAKVGRKCKYLFNAHTFPPRLRKTPEMESFQFRLKLYLLLAFTVLSEIGFMKNGSYNEKIPTAQRK